MYRRGDVGQVARALRLLDALRGYKRGRRVDELAAELDVSTKTVRRDLADLEAAGVEIERPTIDGRAGARLTERSYSYVAITRRERYTLRAMRSMFDVLRGTPLHDDIESVNTKLAQRLAPAERDEDRTFVDRFVYIPDGGTKAYAGKDDVLDAVMTGVLSRKVVRYVHRDHRGRTQRGHLAPYALALYKHGLYAVGRRLKNPTFSPTPRPPRPTPPSRPHATPPARPRRSPSWPSSASSRPSTSAPRASPSRPTSTSRRSCTAPSASTSATPPTPSAS